MGIALLAVWSLVLGAAVLGLTLFAIYGLGTIPRALEAFLEFPDRFMIGTDTFTPERWHYIGSHARFSRGWLADLPLPLAEKVGWRNAEALLRATPLAKG